MIMRKGMTKRVQPDRVMPAFLFSSHAVNGHAEIPEKSANQPFVSGSGPCVMMSPEPPITATIVHAQAASHPKTWAGYERKNATRQRICVVSKIRDAKYGLVAHGRVTVA